MIIYLLEDSPEDAKQSSDILKDHDVRWFPSLKALNYPIDADLFLIDLHLANQETGWTFLEKHSHKTTPIIVLTGLGDVSSAVKAMQMGAVDFLEKPLSQKQIQHLQRFQKNSTHHTWDQIIAEPSSPMQKIKEKLHLLAQGDHSIFLNGESGVGKEVLSQSIHISSPRHSENFIAINCGALSSQLLESELFGHKKGSFTGADKDNLGKIRTADKGTLFLDEIGELPLSAQTRLLRVLQEKVVTPLGSSEEYKVDFRLISATHCNLPQMVQKGTFREDLYYRLCVFSIDIPPLRERPSDIPALSQIIWKNLGQATVLSTSQIKTLQQYSWPGNIRQLKNILEQYSVYQKLGHDLQSLLPNQKINDILPTSQSKHSFQIQKAEEFQSILQRCEYNKSRAARELGLSRGTFIYQWEKLQSLLSTGL